MYTSRFVIYSASGEILRCGGCATSDLGIQAQEGEFLLEGIANDITQKVVDGAVEYKTELSYTLDKPTILPNGVDVATISGLPDDCLATCIGQEITPTLGEITFTADLEDVYTITITHPLYLPTEITVTAT